MILTYLSTTPPQISAEAVEIDNFITNIGSYTGITITAYLTCGTPIVQTYNTTDILDNTKLFYIVPGTPNILYITPQLFSNTAFVDGIYRFDIKFNQTNGYILISNCIFVDITYKCKLATLLASLITESQTPNGENSTSIAYLLHYGLVNASNCGCNCDDMCTAFNELTDILSDIDPQILSDCGC